MQRILKGLLTITIIFSCTVLSSCIKNPTDRTINPYMTANIGTYTFSAEHVYPATLSSQIVDTGTTLIITGQLPTTHEQIVLTITNFKQKQGVYSIVGGQASAEYIHAVTSVAAGGVVAISKITSNTIIGYFSFNTYDGYNILNGNYCVGLPNQ